MRGWMAAGLALCLAGCNQEPQAPIETPKAFTLAHGPGPVQRVECRQGECYWQQRQSTAVLRLIGDDVLLKQTGRGGNSTHLDALESGEYPETPAEGSVDWQPQAAYFRCSLTHPAVLWESDEEFLLDRLKVRAPSGVQVAVVNEYMAACHSLAPGSWNEQTAEKLGYVDAVADQSRHATLAEGLAALEE